MAEINAKSVAQILAQIEQNTRSESTAVLYKSRQELGLKKVKVKIRATIYAITDIDNKKQEFTANLKIRARWKEPIFRDFKEDTDIDWDDQWNPRIELENSVNIRNKDRKYYLKYFHNDTDGIPHVCLEMNISATFKEMFELEEFPLDYQALNIWLISEWPFDQLDLVKDDEFMDNLSVNTFTESKEWELFPQIIGEPVGKPEEREEVLGALDQYPLYTITVQVKRRHQYYMWHHILILFLIQLVSLCVFAIPTVDPNSSTGYFRMMISFIALTVSLLFNIYRQPEIPQIAYWTALDKYSMAAFLTHFFIILENAVILALVNSNIITLSTNILENLDLGLMLFIVAVQITVHCYFIAFFFQTLKKRDKFLTEEKLIFEKTNDKIWKQYIKERKCTWKYEPADNGYQTDLTNYTDIESPQLKLKHARRTQSMKTRREMTQQPHQITGNTAVFNLPLPQSVHLPPRHRAPVKIVEDRLNPKQKTHEVNMSLPALHLITPQPDSVQLRPIESTRPRPGRRSRSRTKNRVGDISQTQSEADSDRQEEV